MTAASERASTALRIDGLALRVRDRTLLTEGRLTVGAGDCVALIGRNGVGKTTLLRAILGLVPAAKGSVWLGGDPVGALSPMARAARAAWLPQTTRAPEPVPAWEIVAAARYRFRESRAASRDAARRALDDMGALTLADRAFPSLSGGEAQRVALAALLAQDAPLLLLDEPGNHLDPAAQLDTYRRIRRLRDEGRAVVCVSHDVNLLGELAATPGEVSVLGLTGRRLVPLGALDDPDLGRSLSEVFGCPFRTVEVDGRRVHVPRPAGTA